MTADDPFNLQRFVERQANGVYEQALAELRAGAFAAQPPLPRVRRGGCGRSEAGRSLEAIFGSLDAMKYRSSMEIFELERPED